MDNVNQLPLQEQLEFYSRLLKEHEAMKKKKEPKPFIVQQLPQNLKVNQISLHNSKVTQTKNRSVIYSDKKYKFHKSNNLGIHDNSRRTVLFNQNQNFTSKYVLSKNQTSKCILPSNKSLFKSNTVRNNTLTTTRNFVANSKNEHKASSVSSNESGKLTSNTKDFIKEIESMTELLKKKNSESQPKTLNSIAKHENVKLNGLLGQKSCRYNSAFSTFKPVKSEIFSKTTNTSNISLKVMPSNINSVHNSKLNYCYTKVNSNHINNPSQLKASNQNKFCYKNANKHTLNSKSSFTFVKPVRNIDQPENGFQKVTSEPYSDSKKVPNNLCISDHTVGTSKSVSLNKEKLRESLYSSSKVNKELPNIIKVKSSSLLKSKSPIVCKSAKVIKPKPISARYIKVNKHLTMPPSKIRQLKYSVHHKNSFSNKIKRKVNNKYKVINKNITPCLNKKTHLRCKKNSSINVESNLDLNDSAIEKFEKNLLVISTALTATPVSKKCDASGKILNHSLTKVNTKLHFKKTPLKKSKTRISKYKIINSDAPRKYSLKRKQNVSNLKSSVKKIKHSKFSLINKHVQSMYVTPVKEKSILVRRLFKSKNVIVNKNASLTSYSAKMIKSKYLTLNKKRSPIWQKHNLYSRVPLHQPKFKGYFLMSRLHSKQNRYRRNATTTYHPKINRKFTSYGCHALSRQFDRSFRVKKCKRNGISGPSTKYVRRISNKVLIRTPENVASRVLHRSINRILTASSKKSLAKTNTYCMFYNRFGRCNRGIKCTYIHDPSKIAVCTRFLRGTCKIDKCPFSHEIAPGKMALCSFFLAGACEKKNCPYRHENLSSDAKPCKAFVQGYCPNGKECKKAHILVCPKYMQGECDKGSSCAFPHPPHKEKKNVQKETETEEKKLTAFWENFLRYFPQDEECVLSLEDESDKNNSVNTCVPKKRQLEEQPSFIPL